MTLSKRAIAEFGGTASLLVVVAGSGIMGGPGAGNAAIALRELLGHRRRALRPHSESGPRLRCPSQSAVSLVEFYPKTKFTEFLLYASAQILGGIAGVILTHAMFGQTVQLPPMTGANCVFLMKSCDFGLLAVVALSGRPSAFDSLRSRPHITAAYWCTSSTSFANPAVTFEV